MRVGWAEGLGPRVEVQEIIVGEKRSDREVLWAQEDWTAFVKWFRSNGGIISSKLTIKVRNGRQGVYFKERMRRGETIVSFPRNLRIDEKTAMKGKAGHIFQRLKNDKCYPDLLVRPPPLLLRPAAVPLPARS